MWPQHWVCVQETCNFVEHDFDEYFSLRAVWDLWNLNSVSIRPFLRLFSNIVFRIWWCMHTTKLSQKCNLPELLFSTMLQCYKCGQNSSIIKTDRQTVVRLLPPLSSRWETSLWATPSGSRRRVSSWASPQRSTPSPTRWTSTSRADPSHPLPPSRIHGPSSSSWWWRWPWCWWDWWSWCSAHAGISISVNM